MDESCGKCIPCRAGTVQLSRLLTKIIDGKATEADLERLEALSGMVKDTSLCGLGQTAPNPVLSTLRYFREEYTSRLRPPTNGFAGVTADAKGTNRETEVSDTDKALRVWCD
jgi:bidirectional [NiFe] hydrogenase diaphorase subunit